MTMKILTAKNKEFLKRLGINVLIAGCLCVGLQPLIPWVSSLALILALEVIIWNWNMWFLKENTELTSLERDYENFRELTELEFSKIDKTLTEQTQIIADYEKIFDSQLVELPCICGGNTFQGLFAHNEENLVECEKCNNKYRVTVNYDSVLIAENHNF